MTALLGLTGCDLPVRYDAAKDVHDFLQAVKDNDRAAFEAHIDRPALRRQLRGQVGKAVAGAGFAGADVDAFLGGHAGDALVDQLIAPETFRIVWVRSGVSPERIPSAAELLPLLRVEGPDSACLHDLKRPDRCALTFHKEAAGWKLAGVDAGAVQVAPRTS